MSTLNKTIGVPSAAFMLPMIYLTLVTLKNSLAAGLQRISDSLFLNDDRALESLPEPKQEHDGGGSKETLREKATKKLNGPDANPSMLGDPVSLKAESSGTIPTPDEAGAGGSSSPSSRSNEKNDKQANNHGDRGGETLREKAAKKLKGPDANPSQLGDPISLKNETSDHIPKPDEAGHPYGGGNIPILGQSSCPALAPKIISF
ncbi:hypothetical protein PG987_009047 [Apiospora arundinis]